MMMTRPSQQEDENPSDYDEPPSSDICFGFTSSSFERGPTSIRLTAAEEDVKTNQQQEEEEQTGSSPLISSWDNHHGGFRRILGTILRAMSPAQKPFLWTIVNALVTMYSILLLVLSALATEYRHYKVLTQKEYILYDFLTTLLWCILVGSTTILHHHVDMDDADVLEADNDNGKRMTMIVSAGGVVDFMLESASWWSSLQQKIELVLALVFLVDSMDVLYTWKYRDEDVAMVGANVALNTISYTYECWACFKKWKEQQEGEGL